MKAFWNSALAGSVAAAVLAVGAAMAQEVVYTSHSPQSHRDNAITLPRFSERISAASGGRMSLAINGGAVLAGAANAAEAISQGAVDAGVLVYNYTPSFFPIVALVGDLPGTIPQISAAATTEMYLLSCPECIAEQVERNMFILFNASTEGYNFICNNAPVETLDSVRGLRVRATGSMARIVSHLGATPVNITFNETYEALQRGQVDCTVLDASNLRVMQLWDVADSVTADLSLGTIHSYGLMVINRDLWRSFSAEDRQIWLDNSAQAVADAVWTTVEETASALREAVETGRVRVLSAAPELRAAVDEALAAQTRDAVQAATDRGVADAEVIAARWEEAVAKWTAIYEEIGAEGNWTDAQWDAYRDRLQTEIFDRVSAD